MVLKILIAVLIVALLGYEIFGFIIAIRKRVKERKAKNQTSETVDEDKSNKGV